MENRRDTREGGSVRPPQDRGGCAGSCLTACTRLEAKARGCATVLVYSFVSGYVRVICICLFESARTRRVSATNAAIKHRDIIKNTMFPPHDSKFAFCRPALHRSHNHTAVSTAFSFPEEEEKVLNFWREIDAFQTSLKLSEGRPVYSFYDGPPFATGLPHYGHLLAGTIKVLDLFI